MIKLFEEYTRTYWSPLIPDELHDPNIPIKVDLDDNLSISQYESSHGETKIFFRFKENNFKKTSLLLGIAKILGTKYEDDPRIRNFQDVEKHCNFQTKLAVVNLFLKEKYPSMNKKDLEERMIELSKWFDLSGKIFGKWNRNEPMPVDKIIERMKEFKKHFLEVEDGIFDQYLMQKNVNKYNL